MRERKILFILLITIISVTIISIGSAYAWFNYSRDGQTNSSLVVGEVYLHMTSGSDTITLTNVFPETKEEARRKNNNKLTFKIEGKNTSHKSILFDILLNTGSSKDGKTRFNANHLKFDLVEVLANNQEKYIVEDQNFTSLSDTILYTGMIDSTDGEIERNYYIRVWLSDDVIISETESGPNVYDPTDFKNRYATVRLSVDGRVSTGRVLYNIMKEDAVMDNINSDYVTNATPGINFGVVSSDENGKGIYMRAGTENDTYPILYYRGEVDNNNVLFNNKCWKIVRSTDTGGVKLIYNGENKGTSEAPNCDNTGEATAISLNINDTPTNAFYFSGDGLTGSLAYNGYMWGTVYGYTNEAPASGAIFGGGFTYSNGKYTLTNTGNGYDATRHYTCNATSASTKCTDIRYYYYTDYYVTLSGGDSISDAIRKMQVNTTSSNVKTIIETWYASNMTGVTNKLEDTIWCNERGASDYGGFAPDGAVESSWIYSAYTRAYSTFVPSVTCPSKNDSFTVNNGKGNQKLTYPIAMLTVDEVMLAGGKNGTASTYYLNSGIQYWTMTPHNLRIGYDANNLFVNTNGRFGYTKVYNAFKIRPSVSLNPGTGVSSGEGTVQNPYVII